jgi:hypothetical protein
VTGSVISIVSYSIKDIVDEVALCLGVRLAVMLELGGKPPF